MWDIEIFGVDFFNIFYNFFIYSFFGWIYESCYVSIRKKTWVNRGFMNGPVIPIYGAGATMVYLVFWQYRSQFLLIFFLGMFLATVLEYVTSYIMELLFHAKWWDYSDMRFNLNGRVCLSVSFFWGILSIIMVEFIQPHMVKLIHLIPAKKGEYLAYFIWAIFTMDLIITVVHTLELNKMLGDLQKLKLEFTEYVESIKLFDSKEEIKQKLTNSKIYDLLENFKGFIDENKDKLMERNKNKDGFELKRFRFDTEKHIKEYICKFQSRTNRTSLIQKRLMRAFPNMQFSKRDEAFRDLKERLLKYNKNKKNSEDFR